jgi:hypothetical protein
VVVAIPWRLSDDAAAEAESISVPSGPVNRGVHEVRAAG